MASKEFFVEIYEAFNRRDIEPVLALMSPTVEWANGMEGGFVHGRDAVREYWTRQFGLIDGKVEPFAFETDEEGRDVLTVHQVVRDLEGNLIQDTTVQHIYTVRDGSIQKMEIRKV
jgi:ketosteroid isomerase-like protein